MPIYDFACGQCAATFEEIVSATAEPPECPRCGGRDDVVRALVSRVTIGAKAENLSPPNIKSFTKPRRW